MKRLSLALLVCLITTALALPPATQAVNGAPPQAWVEPLLPFQTRTLNFNISYQAQAESGSAPLAYVELWYRYSVDTCEYTPWTFYARDATCVGQDDCGATFAFTAPRQALYDFIVVAYGQDSLVEDQDWDEEDDWTYVDLSDPVIGWPPNPAPGAVVSGEIEVGTYFNDSWGLAGVVIWDETYDSFKEVWTGFPSCWEFDGPQARPDAREGKAFRKESRRPPVALGPSVGKGVQALGSTGLPAGVYSTQWDTTIVPDGPVEVCFYAEDYGWGDDGGEFWDGNWTMRCVTVIVNNYTAREPQVLSATAVGAPSGLAAEATSWTVTFVGTAPPPAPGPVLPATRRHGAREAGPVSPGPPDSRSQPSLWVEAKVEGAGGFAQEAEGVPIGPDRYWTYSVTLPEGEHTASFRTRTDYGAVSDWVTLAFNPADLPSTNLTMLRQGHEGYVGAEDTYLSQWEPDTNFMWDKLLKVRSYGTKKALVRFDLSPLATLSPAQVDRAILVVWAETQTNPQGMTLKAYPVTTAWDAASANWIEAAAGMPWTLPGASAAPDDYLTEPMATASLAVGRWTVLDVTDVVKQWLDGSLPNNGLLLTGESPGAVRYSLGGSLHTQAGARPALLVESHP